MSCRGILLVTALMLCLQAVAEGIDSMPQPLLESKEFQQMKADYRTCVLLRGSQLLAVAKFDTAVELAPLACRRELLQIKRFMLGSAFKVDVIDSLLESIAEGVLIDLVNALLEEKLAGMLREGS